MVFNRSSATLLVTSTFGYRAGIVRSTVFTIRQWENAERLFELCLCFVSLEMYSVLFETLGEIEFPRASCVTP